MIVTMKTPFSWKSVASRESVLLGVSHDTHIVLFRYYDFVKWAPTRRNKDIGFRPMWRCT